MDENSAHFLFSELTFSQVPVGVYYIILSRTICSIDAWLPSAFFKLTTIYSSTTTHDPFAMKFTAVFIALAAAIAGVSAAPIPTAADLSIIPIIEAQYNHGPLKWRRSVDPLFDLHSRADLFGRTDWFSPERMQGLVSYVNSPEHDKPPVIQ